MLHFISWTLFIQTVLVLTGSYYSVICLLFYRTEIGALLRRRNHTHLFLLFTATALLYQFILYAQTADGNNGLNQANTIVRGYFDTATQLMYAIGAIVGLIGAGKIVSKIAHREHLGTDIAWWFAACIFLVLSASVLKSFYGL